VPGVPLNIEVCEEAILPDRIKASAEKIFIIAVN
jgi:hypothetical protein